MERKIFVTDLLDFIDNESLGRSYGMKRIQDIKIRGKYAILSDVM